MGYSLAELVAVAAHSTPIQPLTLERAHRVMQVHTGCSTDCCRNKRAAYQVLVEAGHIVPDSCRRRRSG